MIIKFDGDDRKVRITKRETEVLYHLSKGAPTDEVAESLHLSKHTVISHRRKLMEKLKAKNTAHLIRKGFEYELLHNEKEDPCEIISKNGSRYPMFEKTYAQSVREW